MTATETATETATRVVVSFPADLSGWGRSQLETPWFRSYLRKTLGDTAVGDTVEVFLDVGCCGDSLDVPLRVERIEGDEDGDGKAGDLTVGEGAEIEYEVREACGLAGGWLVQSRAGPAAPE